jgi:HlyD family secretion protein
MDTTAPKEISAKTDTPKMTSPNGGDGLQQKTMGKPAPDSKQTALIIQKKRKKRVKNWITIAIIAAVAGLGVWYFFFRGEASQIPFIRFAVMDKGDIVKSVSATGTLQATTTVQVGSQVSGTIKALHADFNTRVKKGDLVAELDPTFYEAAVKSAEANYAKAVSDQQIAGRNEERNKKLFTQNLIAQSDYDITETALADAKATVQQLKASLDQANVNLSYTKIHAPISGIVTQRSVDVGQTVAASLSAPVLFIIAEDLTEMEVDANVDEADIGQVKQGEDVTFTVDAFPGEKFHGTVKMVRLNPVIQQNVVTYTVVISAQNKEEKLFPGMTATVTIVNASVQDVIRVPTAATRFTPPNMDNTAIQPTGRMANRDSSQGKKDSSIVGRPRIQSNTAIIYRRSSKQVKPGDVPELEPIQIKTGISDGMLTEVLSSVPGLNPGDSIAVGIVMPSKGPAANAPGTNPFGTAPRPGGGATAPARK